MASMSSSVTPRLPRSSLVMAEASSLTPSRPGRRRAAAASSSCFLRGQQPPAECLARQWHNHPPDPKSAISASWHRNLHVPSWMRHAVYGMQIPHVDCCQHRRTDEIRSRTVNHPASCRTAALFATVPEFVRVSGYDQRTVRKGTALAEIPAFQWSDVAYSSRVDTPGAGHGFGRRRGCCLTQQNPAPSAGRRSQNHNIAARDTTGRPAPFRIRVAAQPGRPPQVLMVPLQLPGLPGTAARQVA